MIRSARFISRYGMRRFLSKPLQNSGKRNYTNPVQRELTKRQPLLAVRIIDIASSLFNEGEPMIEYSFYMEEDDDGG